MSEDLSAQACSAGWSQGPSVSLLDACSVLFMFHPAQAALPEASASPLRHRCGAFPPPHLGCEDVMGSQWGGG